jgi:SpoVK/Ycf46/Vps4 family AAA+-type ATPase
MRPVVPAVALTLLLAASPLRSLAASLDDKHPDAESIAALEAKASLASPREQCFLYAELVHQMIEYSTDEYAAGQYDKASEMLKRVSSFAQKIHIAVSNDEKRLKNAQILLRHTAFRLNELLHSSAIEDRPVVQEALAQVNQVQTETMLQVFRK